MDTPQNPIHIDYTSILAHPNKKLLCVIFNETDAHYKVLQFSNAL